MKKIDPKNYVLTFKAQGVNIFITDIHREIYQKLKAIFIIENGQFSQYFEIGQFEQTKNSGVLFYKNFEKVKKYKNDFKKFILEFEKFYNLNIKNQQFLNKKVTQTFFQYIKRLCEDYTKMNIEYTDKAFMLSEDDLILKKNLQIVTNFKDYVRAFMNLVLFETDGFLNNYLKNLAKQLNLEKDLLENLTQEELLGLYDSDFKNLNKIKKRNNTFVSAWFQNKPMEGSEARKLIKIFKSKKFIQKEVTGQVASPGIVSGKVKIIPVDYSNLEKINREIKKMKTGSILVAETTAPELILACKKAKAIVTDLGGLMSHAAIVSREFGIPCVVGTKIATKIFKDGDLLEVDANKGIVRKIK